MIDNHIHTKLCKHAQGEVFEYVESAIKKGVKEITFTDHNPLPGNFDIAHRMNFEQMDIYADWVRKAQDAYPEIKIGYGIEADYYEGFEKFTESFLNKYDFDLVIMSVHYIKNWTLENWVFNFHFPEKSLSQVYKEYLNTVIKGVNTGLFDILGHADLIKTKNESVLNTQTDLVNRLLSDLKKNNMAIEFNTSGYRKKACGPFPGLDWIPFIQKHNVAITTGSDAHLPEQVALEFPQIYQILINSGFKEIATFSKRKIEFHPLNHL